MMSFPCAKCGLCCRRLGQVAALNDYDRGDGVCRYLKNNLCEIYEHRPDICNVEKMYDLHFKNKISKGEYINKTMSICKLLISESENIHKVHSN
jgi:Fe-S-cluster containining protein